MIILLDFDGTMVHYGPDPMKVEENPGSRQVVDELGAAGHTLHLWTIREGVELRMARRWMDRRFARWVTAEPPTMAGRKPICDLIIDDQCAGIPLWNCLGALRPSVDWHGLRHWLVERRIL